MPLSKCNIIKYLSYFYYKHIRIFKRLFWKLFPKTDEQCLEYLHKTKHITRYPHIASIDETIDKLLSGNYSIARYGDGEYTLCFNRPIKFQQADKKLGKRLRQILKSETHCLIGLPEFRLTNLTSFWKRYWYENLAEINSLLNPKTHYYNQSISREFSVEQLRRLKKLWQKRSVIFVFGKNSRFEYTHEIFSEIANYTTITSLAQNAWSEYDKVLQDTLHHAKTMSNPLIIILLGPTATVLAFDICLAGYQAIDIGHKTNIYDNLMYGKGSPESLPVTKDL